MTVTLPTGAHADEEDFYLDVAPAAHFPHRWRLHRAGITNVWFYYDTEFTLSGGRMVLRGTNGAGKSKALEMLLPFLLDGDRRRMDAALSGKVKLETLMTAGGAEQPNRLGYLWLELERTTEDLDAAGGPVLEHLTLGALVRFSRSTGEAKVYYFTTPLRIGIDLPLLDAARAPLSRDKLAQAIGADRITDSADKHRERVRTQVFGLPGDADADRFDALRLLLRTLRAPDVGNKIEAGLSQILSNVLPPLGDAAIAAAGKQLDDLSETRAAQDRLHATHQQVDRFLRIYSRYAAAAVLHTANAAGRAVDADRAARGALTRGRSAADAADEAELAALSDEAAAETDVAGLDASINGVRESKAYADFRDLNEREARVTAMARTAEQALRGAERERETLDEAHGAVAAAAGRVSEAAAAAAVAGTATATALAAAALPAATTDPVSATAGSVTVRTALVVTDLLGSPVPVERPDPVTLTVAPTDPAETTATVRRQQHAAEQRAKLAVARAADARRLERDEHDVRIAESQATDAETAADTARDAAVLAGAAIDAAATALATAWTSWTADPTTVTLLRSPGWGGVPLLGALLSDPTVLDSWSDQELAVLDHAAAAAAAPARDALTASLTRLDDADRDGLARATALRAEADRLRADVDPDPATPAWVTDDGPGIPLWRLLDFDDNVSDADRAGLEAALEASGLLTASVTSDAAIRAGTGQLLLAPTDAPAQRPATAALTAAPGADPDLVQDVLTRIGLDDPTVGARIAVDGSWTLGPLSGRHTLSAARHIGAAARAAARAQRLAEIDDELAELAAATAGRASERAQLEADRAELDVHARTAPRVQQLVTARAEHERATSAARATAERASSQRATADRRRAAWVAAGTAHRAACDEHGLPHTEDDLRDARDAANAAAVACRDYAAALRTLSDRLESHERSLVRYGTALTRTTGSETEAAHAVREHASAQQELAVLRRHIGAAADAVQVELKKLEAQKATRAGELTEARRTAREAARRSATARSELDRLVEKAEAAEAGLRAAGETLRTQLRVPGLLEAACEDPTPVRDALTGGEVRALVAAVTATVPAPRSVVGEVQVLNAVRELDRDSSGVFDVLTDRVANVVVVDLADSTGRRPIASAAAEFDRRAREGQEALTAREHRVFTDFVLGEVGEELRRRIAQATSLVKAMNASLAGMRTSHGIGMRIHWALDDGDPSARRIKELVATAGALRSPEATAELTELLRTRVQSQHDLDATLGYAAHLAQALDYRVWHTMEAIVLGPEPKRERRLGPRLAVSEGERRFIAYVILFAAVDAYLSGLPDRKALRLLLLDDAFAKVDDRTIGHLMGLLVRLDIDFVMTGHGLWGCYPQVPALDVYEIRRRPDEVSPAITTHVHWDGRTRHLGVAR
jgi:uncharacterized protein (TIGR02680 family)